MPRDPNEQPVDGRAFAGFLVHGMNDSATLADPQRICAELADEPALERVGGGFIDLRDARSVQYPAARAEAHRERKRDAREIHRFIVPWGVMRPAWAARSQVSRAGENRIRVILVNLAATRTRYTAVQAAMSQPRRRLTLSLVLDRKPPS